MYAPLSTHAVLYQSHLQNMAKVEVAFHDELTRSLKDGFTADAVEKAKKTWLDERSIQRAEEGSIAGLLSSRERFGRTLQWDAKLEAAVAALTAQQVSDAFKRHVDPATISTVKGGDFKKAGTYQWCLGMTKNRLSGSDRWLPIDGQSEALVP